MSVRIDCLAPEPNIIPILRWLTPIFGGSEDEDEDEDEEDEGRSEGEIEPRDATDGAIAPILPNALMEVRLPLAGLHLDHVPRLL
jgi:hypothetical protein